MPKYRKKPVVIEARQWDGSPDIAFEICDWIRSEKGSSSYKSAAANGGVEWFSIKTLEGHHKVSPGDFIIKGVQGEFYPCKPDIFEATYELVEK